MITIKNFEDVLKTLEFETVWEHLPKNLIGESTLKVDFENSKIIYPEGSNS